MQVFCKHNQKRHSLEPFVYKHACEISYTQLGDIGDAIEIKRVIPVRFVTYIFMIFSNYACTFEAFVYNCQVISLCMRNVGLVCCDTLLLLT